MSEYTGSLIEYSYPSGSYDSKSSLSSSLSYIYSFIDQKNNYKSQTEYILDSFVGVNIIYRMRAYNANLSSYVYWYVRQSPDTTGRFSGYPVTDLSDIQIQHRRII